MGILLSLYNDGKKYDVFLDFENVKPTNEEMKLYSEVDSVLKEGEKVIQLIKDYKGCQELARKAMNSRSPDDEKAAFKGLLGCVSSILAFYQYAHKLEETLPKLLLGLACAPEEAKRSMQDQQALAKQLADIFNFTLRFDQTRMMRPNLSNDFSYYRRLLPKYGKQFGDEVEVKDDAASAMALFTAEHIPMMTCLAKAGGQALEQNEHCRTALSVMVNVCYQMVKNKKFASKETNLFCARAMTGAIVLYDHITVLGVFHKKSPINVKQCILLLRKEFPEQVTLQNAVQYSTKTFRNAPSSIRDLFD